MPYTVLAVDDDPVQLEIIGTVCSSLDQTEIEFLRAETLTDGIKMCDQRSVDLVLIDHFLPDGTGMNLVDHMHALNPETPVIVITAHESAVDAVEFLRHGADDYLVKPLKGSDIQRVILRSIQRSQELREGGAFYDVVAAERDGSLLLNSLSDTMRSVLSVLGRSAAGTANVLIEGESGTGKEVLARAMHRVSSRKDGPFIVVNCAALPESLIEAELFGAKKGAYTGSTADRKGRFQEADGGTLFIDEVGEIPLSMQVKLLRALQFKQIEPVGSNTTVNFDARIVAATNRTLKDMVDHQEFREDLYYRLRVIGIQVPPLRERKEDIPLLLDSFLQRFAESNGKVIEGVSQEARQCFMRYNYPGNIRELENTVESVVVLARGTIIRRGDLPSHMQFETELNVAGCLDDEVQCDDGNSVLDARLRAFERELIREALDKAEGNQSKAARLLGIGERRLRSRLERLGLRESSSE
ncbi:MAG: sigma-54-dependent Fis family transcriptional regulator [Spirochaetaceae bacterium]|nr:MAG: sigma-54-dependent Fis family transcriptional regulator [Spirochaetaceae bacterium]